MNAVCLAEIFLFDLHSTIEIPPRIWHAFHTVSNHSIMKNQFVLLFCEFGSSSFTKKEKVVW
jgi:hypothetical protein